MSNRQTSPNRVHMLAHANPLAPDAARFKMSVPEYVAFAREHLPRPLRLTCNMKIMAAIENERRGGRTDDALRIRDIQNAIDDPRTLAIVAASGGAYLSRILPHLDLSRLTRRRTPLWTLGFSEMSTLVGWVASYKCGRGLYWLCPNWLGSNIRPVEAARDALAEYWRTLPDIFAGQTPPHPQHLHFEPLRGELVSGRVKSGRIRLVGGCLAVLAAVVGGALGRLLRPDRKWLMLEDLKETPYRIDRHLAAMKLAGWFDRAAGVLIGDFHNLHEDTQPAVLELLKYHLPPQRRLPVIITKSFGHVWPMSPVLLNRPLQMDVKRGAVTIESLPQR